MSHAITLSDISFFGAGALFATVTLFAVALFSYRH